MKILIAAGALLAGALLAGVPAEKSLPPEKTADKKPKKVAGPKAGVKTPGVLIPFESLKAEADFPEPLKPEWMFFSESLYVPGKDSVEKINVKTNKPGDPIAGIAKPCAGMVSAFASLWTASCGEQALLRLDSKTFKVSKKLNIGAASMAGGIAASTDSIWLITDSKPTLTRIDPEENAVVGELRLPAGCRSLLFAETALWVACPEDGKVLRINTATNLVEKTIDTSGMPQALAAGEGSIWVFCKKDGKVDRIDPKTNKVSKTIELDVPGIDGFIAVGEGSVWISQAGFPLTRVNPAADKEKVMQQFYGEGGGAILTSAGAVWMSDLPSGKLLRIDPKRVLATLAE